MKTATKLKHNKNNTKQSNTQKEKQTMAYGRSEQKTNKRQTKQGWGETTKYKQNETKTQQNQHKTQQKQKQTYNGL